MDSANVLKQCFTNSLGDDYIVLNIKTYIKSNRQEVFIPHLHSVALNGWGADYGDPQNYLGQEVYGNDNAYYSANYSYINEITEETPENKALLDTYKEYTKMVEAADAIVDDMDARYAAYAKKQKLTCLTMLWLSHRTTLLVGFSPKLTTTAKHSLCTVVQTTR